MSEQRGGAKEAEHGDDYVNTILFTAGTALVMAYLKRAGLAVFVVEQWRIWVFLFLNLLLLAIVFSSVRNNNNKNKTNSSSEQNHEGDSKDVSAAKEKTKKKEQCKWFEIESEVVLAGNHGEDDKDCVKAMVRDGTSLDECEGDEGPRLSKEEVNERAEAFIMMFRQHLVSDAINGRSNHKRDNIQLSKHVHLHLLQVHG